MLAVSSPPLSPTLSPSHSDNKYSSTMSPHDFHFSAVTSGNSHRHGSPSHVANGDEASGTSPSIYQLPPELIDLLLDFVPPQDLQRTALSIMRVFPDLPISQSHLFKHLRVNRADQLKPLWARLRRDKEQDQGKMIGCVQSFTMASWRGDADLINVILRMLPDLRILHLNLGTNFATEHLEEVFEFPKQKMERIELRFRPYVDKASYYQFLKGSYFDTAIETLIKRWPATPSLTHISLIQDIPPRFSVPHLVKMMDRASLRVAGASSLTSAAVSTVASSAATSDDELMPDDLMEDTTPVEPKGYTGHGPFPFLSERLQGSKPKTFAQPIVFFDIRCLARLAMSQAAQNVTHFRLRVPCRDIAKVLCDGENSAHARRHFPSLRYLDISTTNIRLDGWLPYLIRRYDKLEHIVLDRTNLFGFQGKDRGAELCHELGKICVMAGLARGKEREREIASWDLIQRRNVAIAERDRRRVSQAAQAAANPSSRETGEDAAEGEDILESLPEHNRSTQSSRARARRAGRSVAMANFSIRENTARNRAHDTARQRGDEADDLEIAPTTLAAFVMPALPTLKSVNIGGEASRLNGEKLAEWDRQFHDGWRDGLTKVHEWGKRTVEKFDRAQKAARNWHTSEANSHASTSNRNRKASGSSQRNKSAIQPPLDVRLYRYPQSADEFVAATASILDNPADPSNGLIRIDEQAHDWESPYLLAIADAEVKVALAENGDEVEGEASPGGVLLCCVPDCEGPMRRGEDGDRLDGRSMMRMVDGRVNTVLEHKAGCGHLLGRQLWSAND